LHSQFDEPCYAIKRMKRNYKVKVTCNERHAKKV